MPFDNRTGSHPVQLERLADVLQIDPSSYCARVLCDQELYKIVEGVEVYRNVGGRVKNIPPQRDGVYYIVSGWVAEWMAQKHPERTDIFTPNMHPDHATRSIHGHVVRTRSLLARWAEGL
jgi:hypothetical protein